MNGRVFDPQLGVFTSVDPFVQFPGSTQGWNPYSYVLNNPNAGTDPSGFLVGDNGPVSPNHPSNPIHRWDIYGYRSRVGVFRDPKQRLQGPAPLRPVGEDSAEVALGSVLFPESVNDNLTLADAQYQFETALAGGVAVPGSPFFPFIPLDTARMSASLGRLIEEYPEIHDDLVLRARIQWEILYQLGVVNSPGAQIVSSMGLDDEEGEFDFARAPELSGLAATPPPDDDEGEDFTSELSAHPSTARSRLARAMNTPRGEAAHHLIPWEFRSHPLVQLAARSGFNINGVRNGINLGPTRHFGSHPKYNALVGRELNRAFARNPNMSPQQAARTAHDISARARALIQNSVNKL